MGESADETPWEGGRQPVVTSHCSVRGSSTEHMALVIAYGSL